MRHPKRTLGLLTLLMLLPLVLLSCRGRSGRTVGRERESAATAPQTQAPAAEPTATLTAAPPAPQEPTATAVPPAPQEPTATAAPLTAEEPTLAECRRWLASSRELTLPIACPDWTFFRDELFKRGGGVFPVGDDRYYLVWFPDDWETVTERKVIVSLHGTGGCAEWMLNHWYQTSSADHSWALVALQYYDRETKQYDDDQVIYQNLQAVLDDLQAHCPVAGSDLFYHGFSRGSAQSFPVAIRDRAGRRAFSAFIADSGCSGLDYPALRDAPADALAGARFWMWCGQNDVSTVDPGRMTCDVMEEDMRPYVEKHGGQVDALIREEGAGHGMFSGCPDEAAKDCSPRTADNLGPSLPLLFEYIESFPGTSPATQQDAGSTGETADASPEGETDGMDDGDDTYTIWFIDLDHGDAILIRSEAEHYVLIDAGPFDPSYAVRAHLTSLGVDTIHRAILTHPDGDHFRGFDDIIAHFAIEQFLYTGYASDNEQFADLMEHINGAGIPLVNVRDGDVIEIDNLTISVFHPPGSGLEGENEDNNSLTVIVSNRSGVDFFSGGDLGPAGLRSLSERHAADLDVELLKANHHGCLHDNPAAFVEATSPTHAFLTNEAHPLCDVQGTVEQFQDYGTAVYNTVEHGTIEVQIEGTSYHVETEAAPTPLEWPADVGASHFGQLVGGRERVDFAGAWIRPHPGPFIWGQVEVQPGVYNWEQPDRVVAGAQEQRLAILATVWPFARWDQETCHADQPRAEGAFPELGDLLYSPCDPAAYAAWLTALVERYDGDGLSDMPGLAYPIRHWEISNEPEMQGPQLTFFQEKPEAYLEILRLSHETIKAADANAVVLTAGQAGMQPEFVAYWRPILEGADGLFDLGNVHSIGGSDVFFAPEYRAWLDELGYADKGYWITEALVGRMGPPQPDEDELARLTFTGYATAFSYGAEVVIRVGEHEPGGGPGEASKQTFLLLANTIGDFRSATLLAENAVRFDMPDGRVVYALWDGATLPSEVTGAVKAITYAGEEAQFDAAKVVASVPTLVVTEP